MKIIFDGTIFESELSGIAKSTLCLYEACHHYDSNFKAYGLVNKNITCITSDAIEWINMNSISENNIREIISDNHITIMHLPNNGLSKVPDYGLKKVATINDVLPLEIPHYFGTIDSRPIIKKWVQATITEYRKVKYKYLMHRRISACSLIFTISNYSKNSIMHFFKTDKQIYVVPLGTTLCRSEISKKKTPHENNYIIYWGGYHSRKGIDKLVNSFIKYKKESESDIKLIIVGKKYPLGYECDRELEYGVKNNYILELGYLSDDKLVEYIIGAKALLYLSSYEGFGLPIIEAMDLGCPVVTTNKTSCHEVAGNAAILVDPEKIDEVIEAIRLIDRDEEKRKVLREMGYKRAEFYKWDEAAQIFISALLTIS